MKIIFALTSIAFLVACETTPVTQWNPTTKKALPVAEIELTSNEIHEVPQTGPLFSIDGGKFNLSQTADTELRADLSSKVKKAVIETFSSMGYRLTENANKAHLSLSAGADHVVAQAEEEKTVYQDGQLIEKRKVKQGEHIYRVSFLGTVRDHGHRPKTLFRVTLESKQPFSDSLIPALVAALKKNQLKAPVQTKAMKGDPCCFPRFGFLGDVVDHEKKRVYQLKEVFKGSSAEAAGLKAGDIIEAIDSVPYSSIDFEEPLEAYSKLLPVPIKYIRGGAVKRGMIRAKMRCMDEDN